IVQLNYRYFETCGKVPVGVFKSFCINSLWIMRSIKYRPQKGLQAARPTAVFLALISEAQPMSPACAICRNDCTVSAIRRPASSASSGVSTWLKLKRMLEWSRSRDTPMASKTGDGSNDPLEHAEPVEQAIPARSSRISKASALQPGKETL